MFWAFCATEGESTIWKTQDELTGAVAISIMRATKEIQRPGWQRATDYDEVTLRREVMALQKKNDKLETEISAARKELKSLTAVSDVAFEGCVFEISYRYSRTNSTPRSGVIKRELPELFKLIATQMLDVAIGESAVDIVLKQSFWKEDSVWYTFTDGLQIKAILAQLKALGLIYSEWSAEKTSLFWGLTPKGVSTRNKMIIVRNTPKDKEKA